jgi:hypothetical protein
MAAVDSVTATRLLTADAGKSILFRVKENLY